MSYLKGIRCPRCGYEGRPEEAFDGCPRCREEGISVNFSTHYDFSGHEAALRESFPRDEGPGLWRHRAFLPVDGKTAPISMGEGNTPLLRCRRLGEQLGLPDLYLKNETLNPTWSYKDRLCSVGVTRAVETGAPAVVVSSTGNHGSAVAAYAAAAGLPCVIFTKSGVPDTMKTLMQSYGAYVFATEQSLDRWKIMRWCVKELGWYPLSGYVDPAIGSNCYGVDGYKTLAFELFEQLGGSLPDFIITPSAYADGMYGIWKGVLDLNAVGLTDKKPVMIAAEAWGSLKATLAQGAPAPVAVPAGPTVSFSIGGARSTWQGYTTLLQSGGTAETVTDQEAMEMQRLLARTEGLYAEAASVTTLVVLRKLLEQGRISPDQRVVAVITSTGLKDPAETAKHLPIVPVIEPDPAQLRDKLQSLYGVKLF